MNYWLLKTEPGTYGFDDLVRDRRTVWDGVHNPQALGFLREMKRGDLVLVYHSGKDKAVVGIAAIARGPYADPKEDDDRLVVVDVEAKQRVPHPVTLAQIKADPDFTEFLLVRQSRLSVVPVPKPLWNKLASMAGLRP